MALQLRERGVVRVRPLAGGLDAWRASGLPVESEDGRPADVEVGEVEAPAPRSLAEAKVLDGDSRDVVLGDLWEERPVVLAFVRHFGCILCREFVATLRDHADEIRAAGAEIVVIGHGEPEAAVRFAALFAPDIPVFVDPQRRVYALLGFPRNLGGSANPAVLVAALRAWWSGARQGPTEGDPWQLGGVVIVEPGGEIPYRYASHHAGDHPKIADLLEALRELR